MSNSNINDASNYKKCRKKLYEVYFCIPQIDTVFFNKLEQPEMAETSIFKTLKREYLTPKEINALKKSNPDAYKWVVESVQKGQLYYVQKGQAVIAGTVGELSLIPLSDLDKNYSLVAQNGATQPIASNKDLAEKVTNGEEITWRRIRSNPESQDMFACFVPVKESGTIQTTIGITLAVNHPLSKHGLGDFIIATDNCGQPDLNNRWVVNGLVFANTYNNQGWTQFLANADTIPAITIDKLPQWFSGTSKYEQVNRTTQSEKVTQAEQVVQTSQTSQVVQTTTTTTNTDVQHLQKPNTHKQKSLTEELLLQIYNNGGKHALVKAIKDTNVDLKELESTLTPDGLKTIKQALS